MYVILKKISNLTFLFFLVLCLLLFAFYKTKPVYFITYTEVRSGRKAGISTFSFRTILNFGSVPEVAFSPFRAAFSFGIASLSFISTVCFRKARLVCM